MTRYTLEELEHMTMKRLKEIAREFGIVGYSKWKMATKNENIRVIFRHNLNTQDRVPFAPQIAVPSREAIRQQVAIHSERNDFTRQELDSIATMKRLKEIAKTKGVPKYSTYKVATKSQLILAILAKQSEQPDIPRIHVSPLAQQPDIPRIPVSPLAQQPDIPRIPVSPLAQQPDIHTAVTVRELQMRLQDCQQRFRDLESENQRLKLSLELTEKRLDEGGIDRMKEQTEQLRLQEELSRVVDRLTSTLPLKNMSVEARVTPEMVRQMSYNKLVDLAMKVGIKNASQLMSTGGVNRNRNVARIQKQMNMKRLQDVVIRRLQAIYDKDALPNVAMLELITVRAQKFSNWLSQFPVDVQSHYLYPWFILPQTLESLLGEKLAAEDIAEMVDIDNQQPIVVVEDIADEKQPEPEPRVINRFTSKLTLQNYLRKAQLATTEEEKREGIADIVRAAEPRYVETLQHRRGIETMSSGKVYDILNQIEKNIPPPSTTGTSVPTENVLQKIPQIDRNIAKCLGLL